MKAISLWPPYASFIVAGLKRIETRSWPTKHRGPIAIHQTKTFSPTYMRKLLELDGIAKAMRKCGFGTAEVDPAVPLGCILGTANLIHCSEMTQGTIDMVLPEERIMGDYRIGRYMWILEDIVKFSKPIPVKGKQGIWEWNDGR